jgi:two-component system NtrC family sensor kinase
MLKSNRTIRFRLTIGFMAVVLAANAAILAVTVIHISNVLLGEVQTRVRLNLNSARQVYDSRLRDLAHYLKGVSLDRWRFAHAGETEHQEDLDALLAKIKTEGQLDVVCFVSPDGTVLRRAGSKDVHGDDVRGNPLIDAVIRTHTTQSGTIVLSQAELAIEDSSLVDWVRMDILPTEAARPTSRVEHNDGMAMAAAVPVYGTAGEFSGVLCAATLLNNRFDMVDAIKNQVFQDQVWKGKELGTATLFQDDVRIATNVMSLDGTRAVGTRLSAEVYEAVVEREEVWADRAFVVNDWYITAYEPIHDPRGRVVGVLYVGLLEEPFSGPQHLFQFLFPLLMAITTIVSFGLYLLVTKSILKPVGRIIGLSKKVVAGDLTPRLGIRPPGEMGVLCEAIDRMADAVVEREEKLKELATRQIGRSQKLAAVGRLAAGIAHEINNPLTGVLTFSHLVKEKPNLTEADRKDLDVVIRETTRVREIVRGLLDFARETPSEKRPVDLNAVISRTIKLFRSQKDVRIAIQEYLDPLLPQVYADPNQLQQVFLNLCLNAWEAMPSGGALTFTTAHEQGGIAVRVEDTGTGIEPQLLDRIFEPFFTTKAPGKGTGLGLSISYGIIQQHDGTMTVESTPGQGTRFTVFLPIAEGRDMIRHGEE